jgi:hypothetical protein
VSRKENSIEIYPLTTFAPTGTTVPLYTDGEKSDGVLRLGQVELAFFAFAVVFVTGLHPGNFFRFPRTTSLTSGVCTVIDFVRKRAIGYPAEGREKIHLSAVTLGFPVVKLEYFTFLDVA